MFVVEFEFGSPILQEALAELPEMTVEYEEIYHSGDDITVMFWAEGGDFTSFLDALEDDSTVTDPVLLTETETRRLYRVTYTEEGAAVATFPEWGDLDISFLNARATHRGWEIRMRMPDRETVRRYREICEERGVWFRLQALYESTGTGTRAVTELTQTQREALITARELGYFDIPRSATLADVGDRFEISAQAASERIRRGVATLIDSTLRREAT